MADRCDMHEMDCDSCVNGTVLPPGSYETVNGGMVITHGRTITCENHSVRQIKIVGRKMYCSDYKEKEP